MRIYNRLHLSSIQDVVHDGFEGALLLEGENVDANYDVTQTISATFTKTTWAGVGGTIVLQKPKLSNSSLKYFFSISLTAIIQEPGNLREVSRGQNARDQEWRQHQRVVGQRLFKEMKEFGDVIIVDTTDVYRNLVRKLMLFYKWLAEREKVQFVLKTDDDCFLNLEKIVTQLKTSGSDLTHFWWGNFRRQWFVETYGKWMELDYTADVYPAFACGSGYIIPREISQWLSQNAHRLHSYQGEDVSMGIYMATILPTLIDVSIMIVEDDSSDGRCFVEQENSAIDFPVIEYLKCNDYFIPAVSSEEKHSFGPLLV
ncbi:hypothetical protein FSP39_002253 [Pinctada imbricata]|uniref:Hexosyltransferase n=1 Tax=Pinctada imbricata TaxID=66713 RepID=A0AA88XV43_PINIB|nr:hypothetical protein FSP39_002253 [Pinctada imbricata]